MLTRSRLKKADTVYSTWYTVGSGEGGDECY